MKCKTVGVFVLAMLLAPWTYGDFVSRVDQYKGVRDVGNGGDVVVCRENGVITKVTMLDYYEAEKMRGTKINLGGPELSVDEKLQIALERLKRLSPDRFRLYSDWLSTFDDEKAELENITLVDISDSDHIVLENGCTVEQIVIQHEPRFPEDKRYTINRDLLRYMDNDNLAGLKLHEVSYREGLQHHHTNSISARYFNALISSDRLERMSQENFTKLMVNNIHFYNIEIQGLKIGTGPNFKAPEFQENGLIKTAYVKENSSYHYMQYDFPIERGAVEFYNDGQPKQIDLYASMDFSIGDLTYKLSPQRLEFNQNLVPTSITILDPQVVQVNEKMIPANANSTINFFKDGKPREITAAAIRVWEHKLGTLHLSFDYVGTKHLGTPLSFHKNGELLAAKLREREITTIDTPNLHFCTNVQIPIRFYENGNLHQIGYRFRRAAPPCEDIIFSVGVNKFVSNDSSEITFYESGVPYQVVPKNEEFEITIQGKKMDIKSSSGIYFHSNAKVKTVELMQNITLTTCTGERIEFEKGQELQFNESELVTSSQVKHLYGFWSTAQFTAPKTEYCPEKAEK